MSIEHVTQLPIPMDELHGTELYTRPKAANSWAQPQSTIWPDTKRRAGPIIFLSWEGQESAVVAKAERRLRERCEVDQ